jgi:hypothetical protein
MWIGIVLKSIWIRLIHCNADPDLDPKSGPFTKFYTCLKHRNFLAFIHSSASLHCFIFLVGVTGVNIVDSSVADPGCLSRIPDPDFYPSRISDPKTVTEERGGKKFVIILFFKSQISQN